jgi:hypoxanthine-guanine phosphoribosyltransferase
LIRQISRGRYRGGLAPQGDFLSLAGYGAATAASGNVAIRWADDATVAERNVLIIDDILGTGGIVRWPKEVITAPRAALMFICLLSCAPSCALLERPAPCAATNVWQQMRGGKCVAVLVVFQ